MQPIESGPEPVTTDRTHEPMEPMAAVDQATDQAQRALRQVNQRVMAFARENPGTCLLGCLALGYLVGRMASRSSW